MPQAGAQRKFIPENDAAIRPVTAAEAPRSEANTGRIGMMMLKPSRSMKTVRMRTAIGRIRNCGLGIADCGLEARGCTRFSWR